MKKLLSITLALTVALLCVLSMASCSGSKATACDVHKDLDGNMACDACGAIFVCTDHVDANADDYCDTCEAPFECVGHQDANKDEICDRCKAPYTCPGHEDEDGTGQCDICNAMFVCSHVDANNDEICDNCKGPASCVGHQDADGDKKCDFCKAKFVCKNHKDANGDAKCDLCGENYVCPGHVDADENGVCDSCGASGSALNQVNPETVAAFVRAYKNSLPSKITVETTRTVGSGSDSYILTSSSSLVTGTIGGKNAAVFNEIYYELRDVESGSGDVVQSVFEKVETTREFLQGKGLRETVNGTKGSWNSKGTNFAPTKGSIAIGINESNIKLKNITIDGNVHVMEFSVAKEKVAEVFGQNGALPNVDATSDVTVVLSSNGATITSIVIRYKVASTKDVPEQNVVIAASYEYSIQNITIE